MVDDLFTYELGIVEDFYFPYIEQPHDNLKNGNLDVYEPRVCYDGNKQIKDKAVILINKILERPIDITVEQWLDLKFGDHKKVNKEIMKEVVSTWLIRSYRKQFEEYMEIKRRLEVYGLYTDVKCNPSNVNFAEWLASKLSNHMMMDWYTKNELWLYWTRGDDEVVLTDEELEDEKAAMGVMVASVVLWCGDREGDEVVRRWWRWGRMCVGGVVFASAAGNLVGRDGGVRKL
uniref:SGNH hydrolase-type esterase domain-containing protein n=1 Tax=Tanacetum cinerariifolium TaxID=118510 RepID=A0A6L2LRI6_TANCI|nr:SGNH hydrolase-type esterase domain-containing protein [Tanacetum cinerariifolium]